ncbi:MAG TPA: hypothetical protein VFC09_14240 [Candidatus Dormibacteraeota bacterium]|nr:hypothetical protein [Candidatus Dormibacteraeota bacterium]
MIDEIARPRVGVVIPGGVDEWEAAVAARVLTLALLDRLPRARVSVLVSGGAAPAPSALDCGRPWRRLVAADRRDHDALIVAGAETTVPGRSGCPVVRVPGELRDVVRAAAHAGGEELRRNRRETLRLLGWSGELPEHAGVDEWIAAAGDGQRDDWSRPVVAAIAEGARDPDGGAALRALDGAARAALDCWRGRGSPGAAADMRGARRTASQYAALRVEIRMLEREVEAAEQRAAARDAEMRLVLGSRTWRYTERLRSAYHSTRGRLHR